MTTTATTEKWSDTVSPPDVPTFTTSTNLGALSSTAFPADCLDSLWDMNTLGVGVGWTYETQGCAVSTCCPGENFYTEAWAWMTSYYSPGVCPQQYKPCEPPRSPVLLPTEAGENVAFCCPSDFSCPATDTEKWWEVCQKVLTSSTEVIVLNNMHDQVTLSTRGLDVDPMLGGPKQIAYPIQIRWRNDDTFDSPTGFGGQDGADGGGDLSTGAIVGIVVGAVVFVGTVVGAVFVVLVRRQKRVSRALREALSARVEREDGKDREAPGAREHMEAVSPGPTPAVRELSQGTQVYEMNSATQLHELDARTPSYELLTE